MTDLRPSQCLLPNVALLQKSRAEIECSPRSGGLSLARPFKAGIAEDQIRRRGATG